MKRISLYTLFVISTAAFVSCGDTGNNTAAEETKATTEVNTKEATTTFVVNPEASTVTWAGEMMGMYTHTGTVDIVEGSLTLSGNTLTAGKFVIDMTSITNTDANFDPEKGSTKEKLKGHLESPDFFDVANHPTASLKITGSSGNTASGNLTIRGVEQPATVTDIVMNKDGSISGKLTFDRAKFGAAYKMSAAEMILSDKVNLEITLVAK